MKKYRMQNTFVLQDTIMHPAHPGARARAWDGALATYPVAGIAGEFDSGPSIELGRELESRSASSTRRTGTRSAAPPEASTTWAGARPCSARTERTCSTCGHGSAWRSEFGGLQEGLPVAMLHGCTS